MHRRQINLRNRVNHPAVNLGFFPNYKEWTESFGIWSAIQRINLPINDPSITCVSVGDGQTPRCGSLIAAETKWNVISIDPEMRRSEQTKISRQRSSHPFLSRLNVKRERIQDCPCRYNRVVIVACHCHVTIDDMLDNISAKRRDLICMPCCVEQNDYQGRTPDEEYEDCDVKSPKRVIKIWKGV